MADLARGTRLLRPSPAAAALRGLTPLLVGVAAAYALHAYLEPLLQHFELPGPFYVKVLMDIGINVILAVSLTIVNGFTGQFSIGHAGFMAIGGYTAAAIVYYTSMRVWGDVAVHGGTLSGGADGWLLSGDLLFVGALIAGGLVAALAGLIVGLPSLRLRGDYLAIVTLGFGEIVRVLLQLSSDVLYFPDEVQQASTLTLATSLGGALGFSGIPFYSTLFWIYLCVAITLLVAFRLKESTHGRAYLSIREDEVAAEAMGVPTTRCKVQAFVIAAFLAGIAGGLFAHEVGTSLNPRELGFQKSFDIVIMVVLGGMGSISGAVVAAGLVTILPELLRQPPPVWPLGVLAVAAALAFGGARRWRRAAWTATIFAALEIVRVRAVAAGVNLAEYRMVIYALCLILMMILRPQGLFGLREVWDFIRGARPRKRPVSPSTS
ncbi:MAG: branched-chain amino acid ABC transporter permease [Phycisphaerae bacterium]